MEKISAKWPIETTQKQEVLVNKAYNVLVESLESENPDILNVFFDELSESETQFLTTTFKELGEKSLMMVMRQTYEEIKNEQKNKPFRPANEKSRSNYESSLGYYKASPDTPIPESATAIRISYMALMTYENLEKIVKKDNVRTIQFSKSLLRRLSVNKRELIESNGIEIRVAD